MANANGSIDEIIGQEAIKQIDDATAKMGTLLTTFKESVTAVNLMNDALNKAGSGGSGGLKKATNEFAEFEKVENKLIETTRQYGTEINNLKVLTTQAAAQNKAQAQSTVALKGSYNELQANMQLLIAKYKALSAEMRSGAIGKGLQADIAMANKSLKDLDAGLGNMQRNVGNYGSAIGKVWGGIRQLAYILPGLGIAGIFNLAFEAISPLLDKLMGTNEQLKIQQDLRQKMKQTMESSLESGGKEIVNLDSLYRRATNINLAYKERLKAVNDLQDQYPHYFGNLSKEVIMAGKAKDAYLDLNDQLVKSVIYRGFQSLADEMSKDLPKLLLMQDIISKKLAESYNKKKKPDDYSNEGQIKAQAERKQLLDTLRAIPGIGEELANTMEKQGFTLQEMLTNINELVDESQKKIKQALEAGDAYSSTLIGGKDKKDPKAKQEKVIKEIEIHVKWIEDNLPSTGLSPATVKALGDAYKGMFESINDDIAAEYPQGLGDPEAAQLNLQLSEHANQKRIEADKNKIAEEGNKVRIQKTKEMLDDIVQITNDVGLGLSAISDAITERELLAIDKRDKALKLLYDNELRWIEDSGFSSSEKEKMKAKLAAENEAKQKQIDRDRVTALRKQAKLQKALDINSLIGSTAVAVMSALGAKPYTPANIILASAAAFTGAAQIAAVIATPLPQYAKGRKGGKAEHAIVGEIGQEAIVTTDGKVTLTPSTPSLAYIPQGADVIPHNELIKNSAYVALARQGTVTTDKLQMALIAEFEKNTEKIDELINVTKSKNLTATYNGLGGFESYKQANIR